LLIELAVAVVVVMEAASLVLEAFSNCCLLGMPSSLPLPLALPRPRPSRWASILLPGSGTNVTSQ